MRTILIAAQSLDGFITRHDEPGTAFTSPDDKRWFAEVLTQFDCSLMGAETFRVSRAHILAHLTSARRRVVLTRTPAQFDGLAVEHALEFTSAALPDVLAGLAARGHRQCAILGGAQVHSLSLAAGRVDEIWLSVEPRLFGRGVPFLSGQADVSLRLLQSQATSAGVLQLRYAVVR